MATKASTLCAYVIKQIGKPYWYGTAGQTASASLYKKMKRAHPKYYKATDFPKQYGQKVHDCSGLISAIVSVAHGATSQYKACSSSRSNDRSGFPKIPGTLVFKNKSKGSTQKTHVGVYIGNLTVNGKKYTDAVVEAKGHKWGVVVSSWSSWDSWGKLNSKYCSYDTSVEQKFTSSGSSSTSGASNVNPQSLIKVKQIDPYIATIGPIRTTTDFGSLKKNKVAAMMFNAGSLYDSSHKKKTYKNPYLNEQIFKCDEANMPYALYAIIRAHNEIEADAECKALYYIISEHPPKLGLWLYLDTHKDKSMNDKIIDVYYRYIVDWGLKNRCGIYIEIKNLSNISWSNYQDKFYLWGIDTSLDFKKVEGKLLQPSMFEVK